MLQWLLQMLHNIYDTPVSSKAPNGPRYSFTPSFSSPLMCYHYSIAFHDNADGSRDYRLLLTKATGEGGAVKNMYVWMEGGRGNFSWCTNANNKL